MQHNKLNDKQFPGFPQEPVTNYWQYPKALDDWWYILNGSEQKCLDYILRRTWGFKKDADAIAISQFINGITKYDGTVIDRGTGIKNEKTIRKALRGLIEKDFIEREDRSAIGREPIYKLNIISSQEMEVLLSVGTPPIPSSDNNPLQELVPTIKEVTIKDNNTIPAQPKMEKNPTGDITQVISYLSEKLGGVKFPNYGKQARYAKSILNVGYSIGDIKWAIDRMHSNKWWQENSFDMKNVADEIPKLMTRTFKIGGGK